jgi:crotonobetainyl-CoA:carnitine CoA-transferase CaiB-like acyl-CoA transferase
VDRLLAEWCRERDRWEVTRALQARGVPAYPCMDSRDLTEDPHLAARGFFAHLAHPEAGERAYIGIPWRLTNRGNGVRARAPLIGEHTDATLRDLLGMSASELKALRTRGAIE